jgi:hypothetical protein
MDVLGANRLQRVVCSKRSCGFSTQPAMWPAPGLDDAWLSESCLPLELHRA